MCQRIISVDLMKEMVASRINLFKIRFMFGLSNSRNSQIDLMKEMVAARINLFKIRFMFGLSNSRNSQIVLLSRLSALVPGRPPN